GVIRLHNGAEVGRGVVIGPGTVDQVGTARTAARVWTLPALDGRALILGRSRVSPDPGGGSAPGFGAHPGSGYPPLAAPPGPPPAGVGGSARQPVKCARREVA